MSTDLEIATEKVERLRRENAERSTHIVRQTTTRRWVFGSFIAALLMAIGGYSFASTRGRHDLILQEAAIAEMERSLAEATAHAVKACEDEVREMDRAITTCQQKGIRERPPPPPTPCRCQPGDPLCSCL